MSNAIIKLGASGDVVRTSPLLRVLNGDVDWIVSRKNEPLIRGLRGIRRVVIWEDRFKYNYDSYDLVVSLEDSIEACGFASTLKSREIYGSFLDSKGAVRYSRSSSSWFDMSLISSHGLQKANKLKLKNRLTYQEHVFTGLGFTFKCQGYLLPDVHEGELSGDVAISPVAGSVWPNKNWAFYDQLIDYLEHQGLVVNILPVRENVLDHISDIKGHRIMVSGDSLPMHLAIGLGIQTCALFTCTSPWEIHGYRLLKKIVAPTLDEFFYERRYDPRAVESISVETVQNSIMSMLRD